VVNRVVLIGRLTRDPEVRTTQTGKNVASFFIAVTKRFKPQDGQPDADFFRVSAWGQTAEYVGNYISKGRLVAVDGRLESRKFTDKDGNNREVVEIVADNVNALDRPRDDSSSGGGGASDYGSSSGGGTPRAAPPAASALPDEYDPFADE